MQGQEQEVGRNCGVLRLRRQVLSHSLRQSSAFLISMLMTRFLKSSFCVLVSETVAVTNPRTLSVRLVITSAIY